MSDHLVENTATPVIRLQQMSQQLQALSPEDDWSGVSNRGARRRIQNRLNQRQYRQRRQKNNETIWQNSLAPHHDNGHHVHISSGSLGGVSTTDSSSALFCKLSGMQHSTCTFAPPNIHELMKSFEKQAMENYLTGSPRADHLISLSRINILRAAYENVVAIGMTAESLCLDEAISIFNTEFSEATVPQSLRSTSIQRIVPHHPWLDIFPFPQMRNNMIMAGDSLNDDQLCHDLVGFWDTRDSRATLLVWGSPWDPQNWEVTEAFVRKWTWVLRGCPELLISTNKWRRQRGDKPLIWREVLSME